MRKRPVDLTIDELAEIGQAAGDRAVRAALDAGLSVTGWDAERKKVVVIAAAPGRKKKKALQAAS